MALSNLRHDPQWHSYGPWSVCLKGSEVPTNQWWGPCVENGLVTRRVTAVFKCMDWGKERLWGLLSRTPSTLLPYPDPSVLSCWVFWEKDDLDGDFCVLTLHGCAQSFLVGTMELTMRRDERFPFSYLGSGFQKRLLGLKGNDLWLWLKRYSVMT